MSLSDCVITHQLHELTILAKFVKNNKNNNNGEMKTNQKNSIDSNSAKVDCLYAFSWSEIRHYYKKRIQAHNERGFIDWIYPEAFFRRNCIDCHSHGFVASQITNQIYWLSYICWHVQQVICLFVILHPHSLTRSYTTSHWFAVFVCLWPDTFR